MLMTGYSNAEIWRLILLQTDGKWVIDLTIAPNSVEAESMFLQEVEGSRHECHLAARGFVATIEDIKCLSMFFLGPFDAR